MRVELVWLKVGHSVSCALDLKYIKTEIQLITYESPYKEKKTAYKMCVALRLYIQLGYGLDGRRVGVRLPLRIKDLFLLHEIQTGSMAYQSPVQLIPRAVSLGVNAHSAPSSAEVKKD
jgi:hypothetical protein